jgi:hypothetical protein
MVTTQRVALPSRGAFPNAGPPGVHGTGAARHWTSGAGGRMITPRARRPSDRHRHAPLHRRRGVDEAPARAGGGRLRPGTCSAPASHTRGLHPSLRRGGRYAGRRVLLRFRGCARRPCCRRRADRGALIRSGAGARWPAHRDSTRLGGELRGRRCPPRRSHRSFWSRRTGARVAVDGLTRGR